MRRGGKCEWVSARSFVVALVLEGHFALCVRACVCVCVCVCVGGGGGECECECAELRSRAPFRPVYVSVYACVSMCEKERVCVYAYVHVTNMHVCEKCAGFKVQGLG